MKRFPEDYTEEEVRGTHAAAGKCIQLLVQLMQDGRLIPKHKGDTERILDHFRTHFTGMIDRGIALKDVAAEFAVTEEFLRGFLKEPTERGQK